MHSYLIAWDHASTMPRMNVDYVELEHPIRDTNDLAEVKAILVQRHEWSKDPELQIVSFSPFAVHQSGG
jgi:hypothetical protein